MRLSIALLLGSLCFVSAGFAAENDGYFVVDGKAMTLRNGTVTELKTETMLDDGSRLLPDGTLVMKDGKKSRIAANKFIPMHRQMEVQANREQPALNVSHDRYNAAESAAVTTAAPAVVTTYETVPVYIYPSHARYESDESHWINHSLRFGDNDDNRAYNDPR